MKLSTKLSVLVIAALLGIVLMTATGLTIMHDAFIDSRRDEIVVLLKKVDHLIGGIRERQARGELSDAEAQKLALASISALNVDAQSYYWVKNMQSVNLVHINPAFVGRRMTENRTASGMSDAEAYARGLAQSRYAIVDLLIKRTADKPPEPKLQGVMKVSDWNWLVGTGFFYDDIDRVFNRLAWIMTGIGVAIALGVSAIAAATVRSVRRTLGGEPAHATAIATDIANGNLQVRFDASRAAPGSLVAALAEMRNRLAAMIAEIQSASQAIAHGASEIAQGNLDLSQRTEQQAASLQETAASMEQITGTVRQNADNARQANGLVDTANDATSRGGAAVREVVDTMSLIAQQSERIADITSVIEGIAFQTNILALNAAVEAARAGEDGRGFAVVASEVRSLAQRSASAAKDIKELIQVSVNKVSDGNRLVQVAGERMAEIDRSIGQVSDIIGEISAASAEQATGIDQVGRAVTQMDEVTQQNAALVEQAAAAATSLDEQAGRLRSAVAVFRLA
ncbi:methyl-accepting chemotaxis protein [Burkholderia plantarii]|uniref:methyl-accepting chemotaxis protein n=1 Tax=Burkholderia plantarii TaxID=41899 RepID=UPI0018DDFB3C|nr:methyl-accepting chemotaxis protein [Burkholderia plantarii]MBI0329610.1 cache domain-containing protein [Burkholderia plantarii]